MVWFYALAHTFLMLDSGWPNMRSYVDLCSFLLRLQCQFMTAAMCATTIFLSTLDFNVVMNHELSKVIVSEAKTLIYYIEMLNKVFDRHMEEAIEFILHIAIVFCDYTDVIALPNRIFVAESACPQVFAMWIHELNNCCGISFWSGINLQIKDSSDNVRVPRYDAVFWRFLIFFATASQYVTLALC